MNTITNILNKYDILESEPLTLIRESSDNQVYLVGDKNKKILRLSKRLPIEDVQFEYEVLQHLEINNFPVAPWVKTKDGSIFAFTEGVEVAVMFDFIEGYHATADKDTLPTREQAYTAGKALASMSEVGKTFKPSSPRRRNIFTELERVLENEDVFRNEFERGNDFVEQVKQSIAFARDSKSSVGLIHNDYRTDNVFFKNDNEISGVIDFDWSCIGPQIKDLALGALEWSCADSRTEPDPAIFDAFLEGYNSVSAEKINRGKELYSWIMFAALSDTATYFCDRLTSANTSEQKRKITSSFMYRKYLHFSKQ